MIIAIDLVEVTCNIHFVLNLIAIIMTVRQIRDTNTGAGADGQSDRSRAQVRDCR